MSGPRLAYVVSQWGAPTQTFVRREAETLMRAGCDVRALSLRRPLPVETSIEVVHLGPFRLVFGVIRAVCRRPLVVGGIVSKISWRSSPRNIPAQLLSAFIGLAWAGNRVVDGRHLHAHFGWVTATAAWSCSRVSEVSYDVVLHAFEIHTTRLVDEFASVPLRGARQVWCVVDGDRQIIAAQSGVEAKVLRMGVPEAWLACTANAEPWRLMAVGSLNEKKGHHVLLQALAVADPRWRLDIIGAGPLDCQLRALAHQLGVRDRVRFLGGLPEMEIARRLQHAWVAPLACVEASNGDRDGVPVALMEAMATGVPVVSTNVGGVPELVENAGLLVDPGDVPGLASALDRLSDPSLRHLLGETGRQRVADHWTVERSAIALLRSLQTLTEIPVRTDECSSLGSGL